MSPRVRWMVAGGIAVVAVGLAVVWWPTNDPTPTPTPTPDEPRRVPLQDGRYSPDSTTLGVAPRPVPVAPVVPLEDLARELTGDNGVVCRLEPSLDGGSARLVLDGDPGTWLAVAAAQANVLVLSDIPEAGRGTLLVEGFAPAVVEWTDARDGQGRCNPAPVVLAPAEAAVVGSVSGGRPSAVGVTACGQRVQLDREGDFFASAVPGEPCVVTAERHFGVWKWERTETLQPRADVDTEIAFEAPPFDAVLPLVVEDGIIRAVWDEAVAEDLVGGRLRAVDGVSVPGDLDAFHLATGGAPDSVAEVEVDMDEAVEVVTVRRKTLGFEDWLAR